MKKTLFLILLTGFIFTLLYVKQSHYLLIINKIIALSIPIFWLFYTRIFVLPIHFTIYFSFIFYSLFAALMVSANMEGVLTDIKTMLQLAILLIFIYNIGLSLNLQNDFRFISIVLLIYFLLAYFGHNFGLNIGEDEKSDRLIGVTTNANTLGMLVLYGLISSLYLLKFLKKKVSFFYNLSGIMVFLVFFLLLLPTGSRKSLFAFIVVFVIYLLRDSKINKSNLIKLFSFVLFIFFILKDMIIELFESSIMGVRVLDPNNLESGVNVRERLYYQGIDMFLSSPVFGVGLNNFRFLSETGHEAHSYYMEILADTGMLGFLLLFSVYGYVIYNTYKLRFFSNLRSELDFIWSFLSIVFVMSFGFTSHKDIVHWIIIGFIVLFLSWKKFTYKHTVKS